MGSLHQPKRKSLPPSLSAFYSFPLGLEFLQVPLSSLSLLVYSISIFAKQCKIQSALLCGQITSISFRLLLTSHTSLKAVIQVLTRDRNWKRLPWRCSQHETLCEQPGPQTQVKGCRCKGGFRPPGDVSHCVKEGTVSSKKVKGDT